MGSQKLLALTAYLFVIITVNHVYSQCTGRVEFINQPSAMPTLTAMSYVQPVSQFVIPAVIKPLIQAEPCLPALPPSIPDYSNFYNSICPGPAMPPIILDSGRNNNELDNLIYFLLLSALKNRRNGGFGFNSNNRNGCCENFCSCGGNCNSGNSNNCGGCGNSCVCSNCNGCGNCGGCGKCSGSGGRSCGCCSTGCNNGNSCGNICGCGGNCIFIPYPIGVPISNAIQCGSGGGCSLPVMDTAFGGCDDCQSSSIQACNGQSPNEINLIIKTDC